MIQQAINDWFNLGGEDNAKFEIIKDGYVFGTYFTLRTFAESIEKYDYESINVKPF